MMGGNIIMDVHTNPKLDPSHADEEREKHFLSDLFKAVLIEKKAFLSVFVATVALAGVVIVLLPRYYAASTVLIVAQASQSGGASAAAQLGAMVGLSGAGAVRSPEDMYAALIRSRSIEDEIVRSFGLQARFNAISLSDARSVLEMRTQVAADKKTGLISIVVDDVDARIAADIANAYVSELQKVLSRIAVTEAQQRRQFYEGELKHVQLALREAEVLFRQLQTEKGMVITEALAEAQSRTALELRARIAEKEVQRDTLSRFATGANPDVQRLSAEIASMKVMLRQSEEGRGGGDYGSGRGLDSVRAYREMRTQAAAMEQIVKQLELAKMDEAREGPRLQQVDAAVPPEKPVKPKRLFLAVMASIGAAVLALAVAAIRARSRFAS